MSKLWCWLNTQRLSLPSVLRGSFPIEGHDYYETYLNDDVQILRCVSCGHYSIGYYNGGEPEPPTHNKGSLKEDSK